MEHVSQPTPITSGPALSPSCLGMGALSPLTLGLVSCGGVGALLFTVAYVIEGLTRPGYNWVQQLISTLSLGPGGWATYSVITCALILVFFALFLTTFSSGLGGLYERVSTLAHALWSCVLVAALFFQQRRRPNEPSGQ